MFYEGLNSFLGDDVLSRISRFIVFFVMALALQPAWGADYVAGEVIVKMKGRPSGAKSAAFVGQVSGKLALKATYGRLAMHHMKIQDGRSVEDVLRELRADPNVEYAEPNFILTKVQAEEVPGPEPRVFSIDEIQQELSAVSATGSYSQSGADVKVTQAWGQMSASSSETPIVAIVDTGVDYTHPVFVSTGAIWQNPGETGIDAYGHNKATNGVDDDANGFVDDIRGWNFNSGNNNPMDDDDHGTHVAGIVLGVSQDIFAATLVPAKIRIMPLKFLDANGSGTTSSAISAIYYAVNNGAQVINNSWGGGSYSQGLHDALTYAYNNHVVLVAAAGNSARNNDVDAMYPANYPVPSQISVAATNDWDNLASFSNYGVSTVHVGAPGVGIRSTIIGGSYRYMSGTSMAAPFVAGLSALAIREAPSLTGYQVRNLVVNSATAISGLVPKIISGLRVNSYNTVVNSKSQVGAMATQPSYTPVAPSTVRAPAAESSSGGAGCGMVSTAVVERSLAQGSKDSGPHPLWVFIGFSLLPLIVWQVLRSRSLQVQHSRRKHERFVMNSEIKVKVGERELVGQMKTISVGGISFQADAMLEKGGLVSLQISSPDGSEQMQVDGRIVWNEQNQSYGVQFAEAAGEAAQSIRGWTKGLSKAS